ncbi:MAG: hypothetical protein Q9182_005366 [Xanthomendoza sp. 2 TL-2023]
MSASAQVSKPDPKYDAELKSFLSFMERSEAYYKTEAVFQCINHNKDTQTDYALLEETRASVEQLASNDKKDWNILEHLRDEYGGRPDALDGRIENHENLKHLGGKWGDQDSAERPHDQVQQNRAAEHEKVEEPQR